MRIGVSVDGIKQHDRTGQKATCGKSYFDIAQIISPKL